jgi:hypothetical protein
MTTPAALAPEALPDLVTLPIGEIRPYPRNPRRIPPEAVDAVAESIRRYGYQQPIVVDRDHVVIVGHTRLAALAQLGWTEVPVYVSDLPEERAREYRLVDNRTGELTAWDYNALVLELREFESSLLESFFPDVDLEIGQVTDAVTEADVTDASLAITRVNPGSAAVAHMTAVECPSCANHFEVRTASLPGVTDELLELLLLRASDGEAE